MDQPSRPSARALLRMLALAFMAAALLLQFSMPAVAEQDASETNMYRLYNPNSGEHFYTASLDEAKGVVEAGWQWEGIGWVAPTRSNAPVYRLYSGTDHHFTTSAAERDWDVKQGWKYEGIGWYSDDEQRVPLYRQFNPNVDPSAARNNSGSHNYTMSKEENDGLVSKGWRAEGIGWYGTTAKILPVESFTITTNAWGGGYQDYRVASDGTISKVKTTTMPSTIPASAKGSASQATDVGAEVARVAVACAGTASPDRPIRNTGRNAPWSKVSDPRLSTWYAVADATLGKFGGNTAYSSCAQAVAGVLGATADPDFAGNISGKDAIGVPSTSPGTVWAYIREHPEMYQKVSSANDIRSGDIMCSENHIAIYVGNEAARAKFPNTSATVFQASYPDLYPALSDWSKDYIYSRFGGEVYHVAAKNSAPTYPFIDYRSLM